MEDGDVVAPVRGSILAGILSSVQAAVKWAHLSEYAQELYKAYPELHADVDAVISDVESLIRRLRAI